MKVGSDGSVSRAGVVYNYIPMYHHRGSGIPFPLTILLLLLLLVVVVVVDCWSGTLYVNSKQENDPLPRVHVYLTGTLINVDH